MGPDPLLSELMRRYRFSIVTTGELPVQASRPRDGAPRGRHRGTAPEAFDRRVNRKEITLAIRRDLVCEGCGDAFAYTFPVVASSIVSRGQRMVDSDLVRAELERQLRRRVRCPFCQAVQREDRRSFLHRERQHSLAGIAAVGGTVAGTSVLSGGGYLLAGTWGLMVGLGGSLALTWVLTRWMLAQLLAPLSKS